MDEDRGVIGIVTTRDKHQPRLVAWEVTRNCNLNCVHCRASASRGPYEGELDTAKCLRVLDQIEQVGKPIVILTGGEPLLREDVFELARYGTDKGLRMVMATNGTLITEEVTKRMRSSGIQRVSISLDGATAEQHDRFRKVPGAFDGALEGIELLKKDHLEFQVNTTITRHNVDQAEETLQLACAAWRCSPPHLFTCAHRPCQRHDRSGNRCAGV
jgi:AdoMet-dependent heme synthase